MSKTVVRIAFAVITMVYVLTHFLPRAHAEMPPAAAIVEMNAPVGSGL